MTLRPLPRHMEVVEAVQTQDGEDLRKMMIVSGLEDALLVPGLCVLLPMADAERNRYACSKALKLVIQKQILYDKEITIHLNDVHQYIDAISTSF